MKFPSLKTSAAVAKVKTYLATMTFENQDLPLNLTKQGQYNFSFFKVNSKNPKFKFKYFGPFKSNGSLKINFTFPMIFDQIEQVKIYIFYGLSLLMLQIIFLCL